MDADFAEELAIVHVWEAGMQTVQPRYSNFDKGMNRLGSWRMTGLCVSIAHIGKSGGWAPAAVLLWIMWMTTTFWIQM